MVPTVYLERGSSVPELAELMASRRWTEVVVKPAVSGGAYRTAHVEPRTLARGAARSRTFS